MAQLTTSDASSGTVRDETQRYTVLQLRLLEYLFVNRFRDSNIRYLSEIARSLGKSKPAVAESLGDLQKRGFLASNVDHRRRFYVLTEKGEALAWALNRADELGKVYKSTIAMRSDTSQTDIHDINVALVKEHMAGFVNIFRVLYSDFIKERECIRPVYLMDYSEIYALSDTHTTNGCIKFMFDNKLPEDSYVLPPPSVWEALNNLSHRARTAKTFSKIDILKHPIVRKFCDLLDTPPRDPANLYSQLNFLYRKMGGLSHIIDMLRLDALDIVDLHVDNLVLLAKQGKLKPLSSVTDTSTWDINIEAYMRSYDSLSYMRPYRSISNIIDSLNISLVRWLNDMLYSRKSRYFLRVTHNRIPILCQTSICWQTNGSAPQTLIRTPQFMATRILCKQQIPAEELIEYVDRGVKSVQKLEPAISLLVPEASDASKADMRCPAGFQAIEELESFFKEYLKNYFQRVMSRVIDADSRPALLPDSSLEGVHEALKDKREYARRLDSAHKKLCERLKELKDLFVQRGFVGNDVDLTDDYLRGL